MSPPLLACPDLIRLDGGHPTLHGGQCADCGEIYFPAAASCTRCLSTRMQPVDLGRSGKLWSWTIQGFLPKSPYNSGETPETFQPYGVGYVEMASGIKVESRLTVADESLLKIGMAMELTLVPYRHGDRGPVHTFAFQPATTDAPGARHD